METETRVHRELSIAIQNHKIARAKYEVLVSRRIRSDTQLFAIDDVVQQIKKAREQIMFLANLAGL
jgi:hypothetical protein